MGRLMDPTSSKVERKNSNSFVSSILWVGLVGGAASFVRTVMLNRAQDNIAARLRKEAFESIMTKRDLEWFHMEDTESPVTVEATTLDDKEGGASNKDNTTTANTNNKSSNATSAPTGMTPAAIAVILKEDVDTVANTITATLANLLRSTSSCVFGTYHMLCLNPSLVVMSLGVAPIVGTLAWMTRKYLKNVLAIQKKAAINAASFLEERLNHMSMVKMSNREQAEVEAFGDIQQEYVALGKQSSIANGLSMGTMFTLSTSALCGILYTGGKSVEAGKMNHGELVSFGTYSFMLALGSAGVVKAMSEYMKGIVCAVRLYKLMDVEEDEEALEKDSSNKPAYVAIDVAKVQSMTLENVFFHYKCDPATEVLKNISLKLARGEVVALVGKNGAGKTTIASLLAGLYKPSSGRMLVHSTSTDVDDTSLVLDYTNELDRNHQTHLVQVVPQSPALFNTTILENVKYSCPGASDEDVLAAMKTANCDGFVSKLDGGIQYQVGRNGSRLSGGQRQRLGLARALLSDPVILVLDEPASSLDSEGETAVADAIEACRASNRGLLVITHRLKTLELADRVVVVKEGMVVESGPLKELQKQKDGELCALVPDLL
jgi:ABC-type multidrug transport system fused ATPase/permease subunit